MKLFLCLFISASSFAITNQALLDRVMTLENRVSRLEGKSKSGLKKVDYSNNSLKPQSTPSQSSSPEDVKKAQEQMKGLKKQMDERNQYLEELMNE